MRAAAFVVTAISAFAAFGQTPAQPGTERVLYFKNAATVQDFQEIATVVRLISQVQQANVDNAAKSLTLRGTVVQIAAADWLFQQLDQPANQTPGGPHEYRISGNADDIVRVFYLTNAQTVQEFQEIATIVRSVSDIRWMFTYNLPRAVAIRGTADQGALAEWLFQEVNIPPGVQKTAMREYRMPGSSDDVVRLLYLPHTSNIQEFQEVATLIRSTADIRRLFTYNRAKAVALRGTAGQAALAEWLANELDTPAKRQDAADTHEYRLSGVVDDVVHVFYLPATDTVQDFQRIVTSVRTTTNTRRVFTYNRPRAVAMRGTADQIAMSARLFKEAQ